MGTTTRIKYLWLILAIVIAVLMPIYKAWHHVFTLCICIVMYLAHKSAGADGPPKIIGRNPTKRSV